MYIVEEKFFGDYYLHPFYIVGWEGIWGILFYFYFLLIVQFIPCSSTLFCPYGHLEDTWLAVQQIMFNPWVLFFGLCSVCSVAAFNSLGVSVTKYGSAA